MTSWFDPFLEPVESNSIDYRGPVRRSCELEWLVDRRSALQGMEEAVLAARTTVHIAGWLFVVKTPLQSESVRAAVHSSSSSKTWMDLIRHLVTRSRPVTVRVMQNDFDPFYYTDGHRRCWDTIREISGVFNAIDRDAQDRLQFLATRHGIVSSLPSSPMLKLFHPEATLQHRIRQTVREYNGRKTKTALKEYRRTPGHWSSVLFDRSRGKFTESPTPVKVAHVGSHHQKLIVIDGEVAFCGGVEVTPISINTRTHRHRDINWHDVHCRVSGPAVFDMERNFIIRWNVESDQLMVRLRDELFPSLSEATGGLPSLHFPEIREKPMLPRPSKGTVRMQIHRTVSVADPKTTFDNIRQDVWEGYAKAVDHANDYIYIENQYFRSRALVEALIRRKATRRQLAVVVVLPVAPEELTKETMQDPMVLQPIALQNELIDMLLAAFRSDIGFFSLVERSRAKRPAVTNEANSSQVYVHSKLMIVDDHFATIGSANANPRSFLVDTEMNVAWQHSKVRSFRLDLWGELLGVPGSAIAKWDPAVFVPSWRTIAEKNVRVKPSARTGFVVPHDHERMMKVAPKTWMPKELEMFATATNPSEPGLPRGLEDEGPEDPLIT